MTDPKSIFLQLNYKKLRVLSQGIIPSYLVEHQITSKQLRGTIVPSSSPILASYTSFLHYLRSFAYDTYCCKLVSRESVQTSVVTLFEMPSHLPLSTYTLPSSERLPEDTIRVVLFQLLTFLSHLHSLGLVHLNLTPETVSFHYSPESKLYTSKISEMEYVSDLSSPLPSHRPLHGFPETEQPPEAFQPSPDPTPQWDIWSVGMIFYRLITRSRPIIREGDSSPVLDPLPSDVMVGTGANSFICKLLDPNPMERPSAAEALNHPYMASLPVALRNGLESIYSTQTTLTTIPLLPNNAPRLHLQPQPQPQPQLQPQLQPLPQPQLQPHLQPQPPRFPMYYPPNPSPMPLPLGGFAQQPMPFYPTRSVGIQPPMQFPYQRSSPSGPIQPSSRMITPPVPFLPFQPSVPSQPSIPSPPLPSLSTLYQQNPDFSSDTYHFVPTTAPSSSVAQPNQTAPQPPRANTPPLAHSPPFVHPIVPPSQIVHVNLSSSPPLVLPTVDNPILPFDPIHIEPPSDLFSAHRSTQSEPPPSSPRRSRHESPLASLHLLPEELEDQFETASVVGLNTPSTSSDSTDYDYDLIADLEDMGDRWDLSILPPMARPGNPHLPGWDISWSPEVGMLPMMRHPFAPYSDPQMAIRHQPPFPPFLPAPPQPPSQPHQPPSYPHQPPSQPHQPPSQPHQPPSRPHQPPPTRPPEQGDVRQLRHRLSISHSRTRVSLTNHQIEMLQEEMNTLDEQIRVLSRQRDITSGELSSLQQTQRSQNQILESRTASFRQSFPNENLDVIPPERPTTPPIHITDENVQEFLDSGLLDFATDDPPVHPEARRQMARMILLEQQRASSRFEQRNNRNTPGRNQDAIARQVHQLVIQAEQESQNHQEFIRQTSTHLRRSRQNRLRSVQRMVDESSRELTSYRTAQNRLQANLERHNNRVNAMLQPDAPEVQFRALHDDLRRFRPPRLRFMAMPHLDPPKLTNAQISRFKTVVFKADQTQTEATNSTQTRCCVCMSDYEEGDVLLPLPCEHTFHKDCVGEWLRRQNTCPACKKVVPAPN
ncbi:hypothetical protein BLNAU_1691 [Blattamonas nauphoetae]|uniref:RING-type domain-containing protein n=1 Tax=Blattamonas nauphoetae TaxID=2049346 RepID=A0ABQ9YHG0_9EUKA|nr:hypothetical protein BLNAU_1691 [Blattamonas nauphoetae]